VASHIDNLKPQLALIDSALGYDDGEKPAAEAGLASRPEVWELLTSVDDVDAAKLALDAAAHRARELRIGIAMAQAAKAEAEKQANLASARIAERQAALEAIEAHLVSPLCQRFGAGKTKQVDTGFARVALTRNPPHVALSEQGRKLGEADVVAMLPAELVRIKPQPDKKAIAEALKQGVVVHGFELVTGETRVEWRS